MNKMERLNELVKQKGPLLAGLDPDMEKVLELPKEELGRLFFKKMLFCAAEMFVFIKANHFSMILVAHFENFVL